MYSPLKFLEDLILLYKGNQGILSIWGGFGIGKTTLSLQILFHHMQNNNYNVFIYTKPNFPFIKIYNIFKNTLSKIPKHILFVNCTDFDDLYHLVFALEFLILQNKKVNDKHLKLIVIDSITDLYRLELDQEKKDTNFILNYKLNTILGNLAYFNKNYEINILVVNEVSKRLIEGEIKEIEAGGSVMDYWIQNSIKLERMPKLNERKLIVIKKKINVKNEIILQLTSNGFVS